MSWVKPETESMNGDKDTVEIQEAMVYVPLTINVSILIISVAQTVIWLLGPVALHSLCIMVISVSYLGYLHRLGEALVNWYVVEHL